MQPTAYFRIFDFIVAVYILNTLYIIRAAINSVQL